MALFSLTGDRVDDFIDRDSCTFSLQKFDDSVVLVINPGI